MRIVDPTDLAQMQRTPLECLQRLSLEPLGLYWLKGKPSIGIVTAPDLVQQVLTERTGLFAKGPLSRMARLLIGDGTAASWFPLETPNNYCPFPTLDAFRSKKRQVVSEFLHATEISAAATSIKDLALESFQNRIFADDLDVYSIAHDLLFQVALHELFGCTDTTHLLPENAILRQSTLSVYHHLRSSQGQWIDYYDRLHARDTELWTYLPGRHYRCLRARRRALNRIVTELINHTLSPQQNLQKPLEDAFARNDENWDFMQRSALIGLLLASYENSTTAVAWLAWNLAMHPDWQDRVVHELADAPMIIPTMATIKLYWPVLWSCLQETLRLYPPVWSVGRNVQAETKIGPYKLTAGSTLIISPWLQHHHSELWSDVEKFLPERFSEDAKIPKPNFLPFGSGPHACPGESFARQTICILMAEWLKTWRFVRVKHAAMPQPILGLTQRPHPGVFLRLERRS